MKTAQDVKINFMGYGEISVPKGTRLSHQTACGIDENYHFVDDLTWIEKSYPTISRILKHDATYYGINIPKEFVESSPLTNTLYTHMNLFTVNGFYGSERTATTVFCAEMRNGKTWYVCEGSVNVNATVQELSDGVNVEELSDVDFFTAGKPVESLEELEIQIES